MDRGVDSLGSCSIERNVKSLDITDSTGNSHLSNHIFINDIAIDCAKNKNDRCFVLTEQNSTQAFASPTTKICVALKSPTNISTESKSGVVLTNSDLNQEKKPSYLNIACTVNGYSNLTTYDSSIRRNINKSREVSPIRPSINNIMHCPKEKPITQSEVFPIANQKSNSPTEENPHNAEKRNNAFADIPEHTEDHRSLIQQRMERLYGSVALVEGFYSPKNSHSSRQNNLHNGTSSSKDCVDFLKNGTETKTQSSNHTNAAAFSKNNNIDLPVLRHLSDEFRAQLPAVSPKKQNPSRTMKSHPDPVKVDVTKKNEHIIQKNNQMTEEFNTKSISVISITPSTDCLSEEISVNCSKKPTNSSIPNQKKNNEQNLLVENSISGLKEKDGNYFLNLLKIEEDRILAIANDIDRCYTLLTKNPEITEDVLGFLRSASGKARLLATKKMKQFEGLCLKNLSSSSDEQFITTADDLQGFWDMINLQIDLVNSTFSEVERLKANGWKKPNDEISGDVVPKTQRLNNNTKTKLNSGGGSATKKQQPTVSSTTALKRESQRKQFLELKRKNKIAMANKLAGVVGDDETTNGGGDLNFV